MSATVRQTCATCKGLISWSEDQGTSLTLCATVPPKTVSHCCNCCNLRPPALGTCFVVLFLGFSSAMRRIACLLRRVFLRPSRAEGVRPCAPPITALYSHTFLVYTAPQ